MPYFDRLVRAQAVTKRNNYNFGGETQSILSELPIKVGGNIYNLIIFDNKIEKIPLIDILILRFDTASVVRCYSSTSKSQSRYRPFRFVIFLTRAQSPPDPKATDVFFNACVCCNTFNRHWQTNSTAPLPRL